MIAGFLSSRTNGSSVGHFPWASVLLLLSGLMLGACHPASEPVSAPPGSDTESQIAFFRAKIAETDRHYPSHALLAETLLRRSRETGDHTLLVEARKSAETSLAIQPNYTALKTMAMICNHTHRFADAIEWAGKTAEASPEGLARDSELTAILVEAYLGLGENEKAAAVLNDLITVGQKVDDFYAASSRGALFKAEKKVDDAVKAFEAARQFAAKQGANSRVVWSNVMAAGCLLDSHRAAEAEPYLKLAEAMDAKNSVLQIHKAEFLLASQQPKAALAIYEDILKSSEDPEVHRRAFVIARDLGDTNAANAHFQAAEQGFLKVVDAGEIYTLGPLAQLYCDQGKDIAKAREFAVRNLEYKRDGEAKDTLRCVEGRSGG